MNKISKEIRELRDRNELSQQDVADRSGVSRRAIQELEDPKGNPTWNTIESVYGALGRKNIMVFDETLKDPNAVPRKQLANIVDVIRESIRSELAIQARLTETVPGYDVTFLEVFEQLKSESPRRIGLALAILSGDASFVDEALHPTFRSLLKDL